MTAATVPLINKREVAVRRVLMVSFLVLAVALVSSAPTSGQTLPPDIDGVITCTGNPTDDELVNGEIWQSHTNEIVFKGTCLIDDPIKLIPGKTYTGGTFVQAKGANLPALLANYSYLTPGTSVSSGFTLRSTSVNVNGVDNPGSKDGIVLFSGWTVLEDVTVREAPRHGIRATHTSAHGTEAVGPLPRGRISRSYVTNSGGRGIYFEDSKSAFKDWELSDNTVVYTAGDAIALDNSEGWTIRGNRVGFVGGAGLSAEGMDGTSIDGNFIEDFTTFGISVSMRNNSASTITGNRILKPGAGFGTFLRTRVITGTAILAVTGNALQGSGSGVGLDFAKSPAAGASLVVTSTGNVVRSVPTPRQVGTGVTLSAGL